MLCVQETFAKRSRLQRYVRDLFLQVPASLPSLPGSSQVPQPVNGLTCFLTSLPIRCEISVGWGRPGLLRVPQVSQGEGWEHAWSTVLHIPSLQKSSTHLHASERPVLVPGHRGGEAAFLSCPHYRGRHGTAHSLAAAGAAVKFSEILHPAIKLSHPEKPIMST